MGVPSPRTTVAQLAACQVLLLTNGVLMFAVNSSSLTSGLVVTGTGGWMLLTQLTVPFVAVTSLATSILWPREHRTRAHA